MHLTRFSAKVNSIALTRHELPAIPQTRTKKYRYDSPSHSGLDNVLGPTTIIRIPPTYSPTVLQSYSPTVLQSYAPTLLQTPRPTNATITWMKTWKTVAIIGVGLIGGSIGLALRRGKLADRVIGVGRDLKKLRRARRLGIVSDVSGHLEQGVRDADLVVVCTPVASIVEHVRRVAAACPRQALITDVGSTKSTLVAALNQKLLGGVTFVGSHPLAGSEKAGCENAWDSLFDGRIVIVTPTPSTPESAVRQIVRFWRQLGAEVRRMSPRDHDRAIAVTSHVPHLVASALAASTSAELLPLVATGWADTTRIASGDVRLWEQILMHNRGHVLKSLDKFEKMLTALRSSLESGKPRQLKSILAKGKQHRDTVGS